MSGPPLISAGCQAARFYCVCRPANPPPAALVPTLPWLAALPLALAWEPAGARLCRKNRPWFHRPPALLRTCRGREGRYPGERRCRRQDESGVQQGGVVHHAGVAARTQLLVRSAVGGPGPLRQRRYSAEKIFFLFC